jgi:hypothetical protein
MEPSIIVHHSDSDRKISNGGEESGLGRSTIECSKLKGESEMGDRMYRHDMLGNPIE